MARSGWASLLAKNHYTACFHYRQSLSKKTPIRMNDKATKISLALLLITIGVIQFIGTYPGYLSHDSAYQWWQARSGETTSLWPPGTVYLLALFDRVWIGPHALYVLQIAGYWSCVIAVIAQCGSRLSAIVAALLFGLLPIAWICLPHVWTDVHMAVMLFAAAVCLRAASHARAKDARRRPWLLAASILFMVYASIVRHNAIVALLPLLWWWSAVALSRNDSSLDWPAILRASLLSLFIATAIVAFYQVNVRLASKVRADTFAITLIWDLQAISVATNRNLIPNEISSNTSVEDLRTSYDPLNAVPMYINSKAKWANSTTGLSQDQKTALYSAWFNAITEYPLAYAKHRARVFFRMIGIKRDASIHGGSDDRQRLQLKDNPQHEMAFPQMLGALQKWSDVLKHGWWATPLVWLSASLLALFGLLFRNERSKQRSKLLALPSLALCSSAALYLASLLFTSPAADLRYVLWPTIAALLAAIYATRSASGP
jgi:hypothetical protein